MKRIKYLFPEMSYMDGLLASIDKYTSKIKKVKNRMKYVRQMPDKMLKIRSYNMLRFNKIFEYQDLCNQLVENNLESTAFLYIEQLNADYLRSVFFEEANLLHIAKSIKVPHLEPGDPENIFNLSYYILESVEAGFDLNFIRECMDLFIADDKELEKYYDAVKKEFSFKVMRDIFYADDKKAYKEKMADLRMRLSALFSMKCLPDNETLDQSIEKEIEKYTLQLEKDGKNSKGKPFVKNVGGYDFDGKKFNPLKPDPQKER